MIQLTLPFESPAPNDTSSWLEVALIVRLPHLPRALIRLEMLNPTNPVVCAAIIGARRDLAEIRGGARRPR